MSQKKPLVLEDGLPRQLKTGDDLDLPIEDRFLELSNKFNLLIFWLAENGFSLPPEFNSNLEEAEKGIS